MSNKIKPCDLSLYDPPPEPELEGIPRVRDGAYYNAVSVCRQKVWTYMESVEWLTTVVKEKFGTAKAHTESVVESARADRSLLPRIGIITLATFGGVVAGYRGGLVRKALLGAAAGGTATAVCYPNEATSLTKQGWEEVRTYVGSISGSKTTEEKSDSEKEATKHDSPAETPVETSPSGSEQKELKVEGDTGMSDPRDKDMYTTRDG